MLQDTEYLKYKGNEEAVDEFFHGLVFFREKKVIDALLGFSNFRGFAIDEYMSCHFAKEFPDRNDEEYFGEEGVVFYLDYPAVQEDVVVVLTNEEFYQVVKDCYDDYAMNHKEKQEQVVKLLSELKRNLDV